MDILVSQTFLTLVESSVLLTRVRKDVSPLLTLGINSDQDKVTRFAETFDCEVGSFSSSYLGLPLSGNPRALTFWDLICEKIRKRLTGCVLLFRVFGGRTKICKFSLCYLFLSPILRNTRSFKINSC